MTHPTPAASLAEQDLRDLLRSLLAAPDCDHIQELTDPEAPQLHSVWLDDVLLGAGGSPSEALADAVATVRGWESRAGR